MRTPGDPGAFGSGSPRAGVMGARVTRVISNFNVENRAHREISKNKAKAAPRHPDTPAPTTKFQEDVKRKDEQLHTFLKEVYVDSSDPVLHRKNKGRSLSPNQEESRLIKDGRFNRLDINTVPKGKILIEEALTLLHNHHRSPEIWTAEKIAKEYSLEMKDVTDLLAFYIPFTVELLPPEDQKKVDSK